LLDGGIADEGGTWRGRAHALRGVARLLLTEHACIVGVRIAARSRSKGRRCLQGRRRRRRRGEGDRGGMPQHKRAPACQRASGWRTCARARPVLGQQLPPRLSQALPKQPPCATSRCPCLKRARPPSGQLAAAAQACKCACRWQAMRGVTGVRGEEGCTFGCTSLNSLNWRRLRSCSSEPAGGAAAAPMPFAPVAPAELPRDAGGGTAA
jgi:hypothetical protein